MKLFGFGTCPLLHTQTHATVYGQVARQPFETLLAHQAQHQPARPLGRALHMCVGPHGAYCRGDCPKLLLTTGIPRSPPNQDL